MFDHCAATGASPPLIHHMRWARQRKQAPGDWLEGRQNPNADQHAGGYQSLGVAGRAAQWSNIRCPCPGWWSILNAPATSRKDCQKPGQAATDAWLYIAIVTNNTSTVFLMTVCVGLRTDAIGIKRVPVALFQNAFAQRRCAEIIGGGVSCCH